MIINGDLESAQLERFTTVNLPNPATHKGRLVYDTTINMALFSNGTSWISLVAVSNSIAENVTVLPSPILADKGRLVYLTTNAYLYYNADGSNYYKIIREQDFIDTSRVGDVKHSMLTEVQFNAQTGYGGAVWVLADGRSCVGSAYTLITGSLNVPDMRGAFLRAKGATYNPDGDLALGTYTADKFKSHNHSVPTTNTVISALAGYSRGGDNSSYLDYLQANGGNETAPRSITVNVFIRIE